MMKQTSAAHKNSSKVEYLKCQNIRRHPLDVSIPIKKQVELYRQITMVGNTTGSRVEGVQELPIVRVGKVLRGKLVEYFLLADVDVYLGVLEAAEESKQNSDKVILKCQVETFATITDFLIQHVQYNSRPTGFNPLLMRRVATYVIEHGEYTGSSSSDDISKLFGITNTVNQKFLTVDITEEAVAVLTELCELLANNLSQFILPYYIPHTIAKRERRLQGMIAEGIVSLVRVRPISDARFAWPGPEEINTMIDSLKQAEIREKEKQREKAEEERREKAEQRKKKKKKQEQEEQGTLDEQEENKEEGEEEYEEGEEEEAKNEEDNIVYPSGDKKPTAASIRQSKEILKSAHNVLIIPKGTGHPAYVVDSKAKRVSAVIDDRYHKIIKLDDVGASTPYMIPQAAEEWLGLSVGDISTTDYDKVEVKGGNELTNTKDVKMQTFADLQDLEKFIIKQKKSTKCEIRGVIFYK